MAGAIWLKIGNTIAATAGQSANVLRLNPASGVLPKPQLSAERQPIRLRLLIIETKPIHPIRQSQPMASMNTIQTRITNSFKAQGLMKTLGATLTRVEEGEVHIVLPFSSHLSQQHGYLHAGAVTSIVDSACGYAALTMAPDDYEVVTAEFKINLLRPALGAGFVAIGKVQNAGRLLTVCNGEVRVLNANQVPGKVIALMQATIVNVQRAIQAA